MNQISDAIYCVKCFDKRQRLLWRFLSSRCSVKYSSVHILYGCTMKLLNARSGMCRSPKYSYNRQLFHEYCSVCWIPPIFWAVPLHSVADCLLNLENVVSIVGVRRSIRNSQFNDVHSEKIFKLFYFCFLLCFVRLDFTYCIDYEVLTNGQGIVAFHLILFICRV